MNPALQPPLPRRSLLVAAGLVLITLAGFAAVSRLVSAFRQYQLHLADEIYHAGLAKQAAGQLNQAIEDFRAALLYSPDNDQLQLSLGRALRDSNRLEEAELYLLTLWERTPEDGTINLALGRLAARRGALDDALRYYHSAIYGRWKSDPEMQIRSARFELCEFLIQRGAFAQAQSELLALLPTLPRDPEPRLRIATLFSRAQDPTHALAQYRIVLQSERENRAALVGAGEAAFQLGEYRSAQTYLQQAAGGGNADPQVEKMLHTAGLVLRSDPYLRGISDAERDRRIMAAFNQGGARLSACAQKRGVVWTGTPLALLQSEWTSFKPRLSRLGKQRETDLPELVMDLVSRIESETAAECGPPEDVDQALVLISRDRAGADR
jgi:tetratricopeptide (TPR) repeat protein